ncbi:hypothetical protein R6Q59_032083 [Mikania micrantha]
MLSMYEMEKELIIYVSTKNNIDTQAKEQSIQDEVIDELNGEEESEYSLSDESYHSYYDIDNEIETWVNMKFVEVVKIELR